MRTNKNLPTQYYCEIVISVALLLKYKEWSNRQVKPRNNKNLL